MKKVYTANDIASLLASGGDLSSIPANAIITP